MLERVVAVCAFVWLAFAQQAAATGSVSGSLVDFDGGVIPGAEVEVVVGGVRRKTIVNGDGRFLIDGLPVGRHELTIKLPGFLTARKEVSIAPSQTTTWDAQIMPFMVRVPDGEVEPDPTDATLALAVYEVAIQHAFRSKVPDLYQVNSSSLVVPSMIDLDWPSTPARFPAELRTALTSTRRAFVVRANVLPPGARLITNKEFQAFWSSSGTQRPPRLAFTRVFASADGLNALVVYDFHCGTLCGNQTMLWLRRTSRSTQWTVHESWEFAMY